MATLVAMVVLVTVLCLFELILILGVIRRLRQHATILDGLARGRGTEGGPVAGDLPQPGAAVGAFHAVTVDGEVISHEDLHRPTTLAFLTSGCPACARQLSTLVASAGERERSATLVVVAGGGVGVPSMVEQLQPAARVVLEDFDGPLAMAFGVGSFPAFCEVREGRVTASAVDVSGLPVRR
jgi:hypothetical protein